MPDRDRAVLHSHRVGQGHGILQAIRVCPVDGVSRDPGLVIASLDLQRPIHQLHTVAHGIGDQALNVLTDLIHADVQALFVCGGKMIAITTGHSMEVATRIIKRKAYGIDLTAVLFEFAKVSGFLFSPPVLLCLLWIPIGAGTVGHDDHDLVRITILFKAGEGFFNTRRKKS